MCLKKWVLDTYVDESLENKFDYEKWKREQVDFDEELTVEEKIKLCDPDFDQS